MSICHVFCQGVFDNWHCFWPPIALKESLVCGQFLDIYKIECRNNVKSLEKKLVLRLAFFVQRLAFLHHKNTNPGRGRSAQPPPFPPSPQSPHSPTYTIDTWAKRLPDAHHSETAALRICQLLNVNARRSIEGVVPRLKGLGAVDVE